MAVTNFIQSIWSKKIQDDLELKCKLVDNCLRDYEGDVKHAQSVKILGVGEPTIGAYDSTKDINIEEMSDKGQILTIDQANYFAFYVDDMQRHTCEMAITNNERKRLYSFGSSILGMRDVKVKFVATNRDDQDIGTTRTITYKPNGGSGSDIVVEHSFGSQVEIKPIDTFSKGSSRIAKWTQNADGTGYAYLPSQKVTMTSNLVLYAKWE